MSPDTNCQFSHRTPTPLYPGTPQIKFRHDETHPHRRHPPGPRNIRSGQHAPDPHASVNGPLTSPDSPQGTLSLFGTTPLRSESPACRCTGARQKPRPGTSPAAHPARTTRRFPHRSHGTRAGAPPSLRIPLPLSRISPSANNRIVTTKIFRLSILQSQSGKTGVRKRPGIPVRMIAGNHSMTRTPVSG